MKAAAQRAHAEHHSCERLGERGLLDRAAKPGTDPPQNTATQGTPWRGKHGGRVKATQRPLISGAPSWLVLLWKPR